MSHQRKTELELNPAQLRAKAAVRAQLEARELSSTREVVWNCLQLDPEATRHGAETIEITGAETTFAQAAAAALARLEERFKKQ